MERRIVNKVDTYQVNFKNAIKEWLSENKCNTINKNGDDKSSDFLQFVYDYAGIGITKEDFQKRKRVKNQVPHCDRCIAKKAEGDKQCTRRKKDESFCGTHIKGTPHGVIALKNMEETDANPITTQKVEVWVQEIKGINYYIDAVNNVYKSEDIISNKTSPSIVAKWALTEGESGIYTIPEFNI